MTISFSLPYRTTYGQRLVLCGSWDALGHWTLDNALPLHYDEATTRWSGEIDSPGAAAELQYKYVLLLPGGGVVWEWGDNRTLALPAAGSSVQHLEVRDYWRAPAQDTNELFTAAFTEVLFRRPAPTATKSVKSKVKKAAAPVAGLANVRFRLAAPRWDADAVRVLDAAEAALG